MERIVDPLQGSLRDCSLREYINPRKRKEIEKMDEKQIELQEKIKALLLRKYGSTSRESMEKLFKSYDKNKNGDIDKSELEQLLKDADIGNGLTRGMWASGIIEKLDSGRDKSISWKEFDSAISSN